MKVIPSLDLSGGRVVKRVKGVKDSGLVVGDVYDVAEELYNLGYDSLHIVDLDAVEGGNSNEDLIKRISGLGFKWVQVGGGIRDVEKACRILSYGASSIVVSTMFYEDSQTFSKLVGVVGNDKVLVAVDYDEDLYVRVRGWVVRSVNIYEALNKINTYKVLGVMFTYIGAEGTEEGVDRRIGEFVPMVKGLKEYAGGISTLDDLISLKELGIDCAIVGMALYRGSLLGVRYV